MRSANADGAGDAVRTADRDAWGNLRASSGVGGDFGWTGEQRDAETGLTYLRSRYYAPGSARFLTRDTLMPNAGGTQGDNGYAYANGNPVTLTDPSGHAAGLGAAVGNVFEVIVRLFDLLLYGEARYGRAHGGGFGAPTIDRVLVGNEGTAGSGGAHDPNDWPNLPRPPFGGMRSHLLYGGGGKDSGGGGPIFPGANADAIPLPEEQLWFVEQVVPEFEAAGYRGIRIFENGARATGWSTKYGRAAEEWSDFDIVIIQDTEGLAQNDLRLWETVTKTRLKLETTEYGVPNASEGNISARSPYITSEPPEGLGVKDLPSEWNYFGPYDTEIGMRAYDIDSAGNPIYPKVTYKFYRSVWDMYQNGKPYIEFFRW